MTLDQMQVASSIIGIIGGILGLITFIDTYALKFKPTLSVSSKLFFQFNSNAKHEQLKGIEVESIFLNIEVINKRVRLGRVDDFAIRIYDASTISPKSLMLYAENLILELPSSPAKLLKAEKTVFTSISVLGKSSKRLVVEFKPERYRSCFVSPEGHLKMELLHYTIEGGWKSSETYSPHRFRGNTQNVSDNDVAVYSLLDTEISREKAGKALRVPQSSLYKGLSDLVIRQYANNFRHKLRSTVARVASIFRLCSEVVGLCATELFEKNIKWLVIKRKSKKLPSAITSFPKAHLAKDTAAALGQCNTYITDLATKLNKDCDENARIIVGPVKGSEFKVTRGRLSFKFYAGGDGYVRAEDASGFIKKYAFELVLVEHPFGVKLWKVNKRTMTLRSACIVILDTLVLAAH